MAPADTGIPTATAIANGGGLLTGASENGKRLPGPPTYHWNLSGGEGGYHYSLFSLTQRLGEYSPPKLNDATNWYAKVVDLLITEQNPDGS